jgi:hypothetical protein
MFGSHGWFSFPSVWSWHLPLPLREFTPSEEVDNEVPDLDDLPPHVFAPPAVLFLQVSDPAPGFEDTNHLECGTDSGDDQPQPEPPPWHSFLLAPMERARFDIAIEQSTQELLESMTTSEETKFFDMLNESAIANDMDHNEAFLVFF